LTERTTLSFIQSLNIQYSPWQCTGVLISP